MWSERRASFRCRQNGSSIVLLFQPLGVLLPILARCPDVIVQDIGQPQLRGRVPRYLPLYVPAIIGVRTVRAMLVFVHRIETPQRLPKHGGDLVPITQHAQAHRLSFII
jgi:hypothetical protein